MAEHAKVAAPGYRIRDLTAGIVVLGIGAAMIHTVASNGEGESVFLTRWAFLTGAAALVLAYGTGMVLDRLGGRYPVLTKRRESRLPAAIVASVALTAIGYGIYVARDWVMPLIEGLIARA